MTKPIYQHLRTGAKFEVIDSNTKDVKIKCVEMGILPFVQVGTISIISKLILKIAYKKIKTI